MPGLASTTAAGLARRFTDAQWHAVETGLGDVAAAALAALAVVAPARAAALCETVTIDLDTTDVEVYGRKKRGVAFNHQGQRVGRPHVATWAETETVLAADLMARHATTRARHAAGSAAPRAGRAARRGAGRAGPAARRRRLLRRASWPAPRCSPRSSSRSARSRIAPLWRLLDGVAETTGPTRSTWTNAQVAVAEYCPDWWPAATRLLIRRVRLDVTAGQVSADPRARRRRTLHPDQRALPITELAAADAVYGYSFIVTNLDVSTGERAAAVEHWYRHRTSIENMFRDAKLGAALRHLPSGYPQVNTAWMWGALLAASIAGWLHQLTATRSGARLFGHGIRGARVGRGELVQPAGDARGEQRAPHPRGVDLRVSRREVPQGGPELAVAEHVLDRGPVPVPVLHRDRPLTGGHVQVGQDERVAVDGASAPGQLRERHVPLAGVQGAATSGPRVAESSCRPQRRAGPGGSAAGSPPATSPGGPLGDRDLRIRHVDRVGPVGLGDTVEDPPQRRDPARADGELDLGEQRRAGQLPGEVAGVGAQSDPPRPALRPGARPARGAAVQRRGRGGRHGQTSGRRPAPWRCRQVATCRYPLALVIERNPAFLAAVDLHVGGVQVDRHRLAQRRPAPAPPAANAASAAARPHRRARPHRMPLCASVNFRASFRTVEASPGTAANTCPASSAR